MNFIYSRNEIWRKYPYANIFMLLWTTCLAITNYVLYVVNNIFLFVTVYDEPSCGKHFLAIWVLFYVLFAFVFILSRNRINDFTLLPNRNCKMNVYFPNFTFFYAFSFLTIYVTTCFFNDKHDKNKFCNEFSNCKYTYSISVLHLNIIFLWLNTTLIHIIITWIFFYHQTKNNVIIVTVPETNINDECAICLENLNHPAGSLNGARDIIKTSCNHYFHNDCLLTWININRNCPICRITFEDIV